MKIMKKQITLVISFVLFLGLMGMNTAVGQQIIGSYPLMDGGFENQSGTLSTAATISSEQTTWTTQIAGAGVINTGGGRSGEKYVTYTQSGTTHRRLQSPTDNVTTGQHVVQFFYQGDLDGTIGGDIRGAISAVGTSSPQYGAYHTDPNTGSVWTKYTAVVNPGGTPAFGIGIVSTNQTGQFKIDDFVIYAGSSVDETAPNSPGTVTVDNATQTTLDISWVAASGGVDGGGYIVVRYTVNPNDDNDPNQNGIYAVGNTITNGTDNLVGTVRYIGTGISFTDDVGLVANTQYWYKVYTVDKAFNYSDETEGNGTTLSGTTPIITIAPSSLTGFTYQEGSGPSTEQSFVISGSNMEGNITITPPANYQISKTSGSGFVGSAITLLHDNGTIGDSTIYVQLKASLGVNDYNNEVITASSTNAIDKTVTCSGNVTVAPDPEPTNHVVNFTATVNSFAQITLTWDDATGAQLPSGYLIKAAVDPATPTAPVDGTVETNALLVKNIAYGVEEVVFTGLTSSTTYNFAIWPYSNSGTDINYKTDGTVPEDSKTTASLPDTMAFYMFENNLDAQSGAIGNPTLTASAAVSYFGGLTGQAGSFGTAGGKYFEFSISASGYKDLSISWYARRSSTVGTWEITASSDGVNFGSVLYNEPIGEVFAFHSLSLSNDFNNKGVIKIRFTANDGYTGTLRIDNMVIYGHQITDATYNTIAIDGTNDGWKGGEVFDNITSPVSDYAHFTWDQDYLYFAVSGSEASLGNMATFLYFNTDPENPYNGTTDAYTWGNNVVTPFKVDRVLVFKNAIGADYMELREWNGSTWDQTVSFSGLNYNSGEIQFAIGSNYREIKVSRSTLGIGAVGSKIKVASLTEQQDGTNWRYFGWPSEGWSDGNRAPGQNLTHSYNFTLEQYIYPNEEVTPGVDKYLKKDVYLTSATTLNTDVDYSDLIVEPNIKLTIENGVTVNVDGNFMILSNATGTGSFVDNGTLNVSGSTIVQKYLLDNTSYGWYISSPLVSAPFNTFSDADGLFTYNAANANWVRLDSSAATLLSKATGYVTKYQTEGNYTVAFEGGILNTGSVVNNALVRQSSPNNYGWNLVGNPYPSFIDWETGINTTNLNNSVHIRKSDGDVATYINGQGLNAGSRYIAPMQAFWVQVEQAQGTGSIEFTNATRLHNDTINFFKTSSSNLLRLLIERNSFTDEAIIRFENNATDMFDKNYDAAKLFSFNEEQPQIFSFINNNEELACNSYPVLTSNKTVALGFNTQKTGMFTLNANNIASFDNNIDIILEDLYNNVLIDLRQQDTYTFNSGIANTNDRFVIHFNIITTGNNNILTDYNVGIYTYDNVIYISNVNTDNTVLSIVNMLGQEVYSGILNSAALNKVNVNLTTGHYIVRLSNNTQIQSKKVFIN